MKNLADIKIQDAFFALVDWFSKTTKKQRIMLGIVVLLLIIAYFVGKNFWERRTILKQAQRIVAQISRTQREFFEKDKAYKADIFADQMLAGSLGIGYNNFDESEGFSMAGRGDGMGLRQDERNTDYTVGQSGDFYIENDAENGCVVLKYKRNTPQKTIYYASFDQGKTYCQGTKCLKETKNNTVNLCYENGGCFPQKQKQITERVCGDGNGKQTRECVPSCEEGSCKNWSECICKKGFEWDGNTCKQSQTEKDCREDQCFNGIYCEDKDNLTKNIKHGSCTRRSLCQKNRGWLYTDWECSCEGNFCSLKEECITRPQDKDKLDLPEQGNVCFGISYQCENGKGWQAKAKQCDCNAIGTFWDTKEGNAQCSECTKKPVDAVFTSAGKNQDTCTWKCKEGYYYRNNSCLKPNGQYLCADTDLSTCTDYFSKSRKMKIDAKNTNEGQPCFVEDKDNTLYYNKKSSSCQICECVVNFKN